MDLDNVEAGDTVVVRRPDSEIEIWKVDESLEDRVILHHEEKTEMKDGGEVPVERSIDSGEFEKMLDKDAVSLLKNPLEKLYFYEGEDQ